MKVAIICVMLLCYIGMVCSLVEIGRLVDYVWICWLAGFICTVGIGAVICEILGD